MAGVHWDDSGAALLHPKNMLTRLIVKTLYDTKLPQAIMPDQQSGLPDMEYPVWSSEKTGGLSPRRQGKRSRSTQGSLDRVIVRSKEYGEHMEILERDRNLLVNIRNQIVDTLTNLFLLRKQHRKYQFLTNDTANPTTGANVESNAWDGPGIQGTEPFAFDGYYKILDGTTEWNDAVGGDPFGDLGAAKRRIKEETQGEGAWIIWSSRQEEILLRRSDIQRLLADNNNLVSLDGGGAFAMIDKMRVVATDIISKAEIYGTETQLNRDVTIVLADPEFHGLTHVHQRETFVVNDRLSSHRAIDIEIQTQFECHTQRFRTGFQLLSTVDN